MRSKGVAMRRRFRAWLNTVLHPGDKPSGEGVLRLEGTGWSRRGAFRHCKAQRPFLSAGKGGLESDQAACAGQSLRDQAEQARLSAWNGHPGLGNAQMPWTVISFPYAVC